MHLLRVLTQRNKSFANVKDTIIKIFHDASLLLFDIELKFQLKE